MSLFDTSMLSLLLREFRRSMKGLLTDLCDDLEQHYPQSVRQLGLPLGFFRLLGRSFKNEDYSGWKVVGWIEAVNDLVYFIDLRDQLCRDQEPAGFAEQLYAECEEKFYENSYLEELFPAGRPEVRGLDRRLQRLCARLGQEVLQESLFFFPDLPCRWVASRQRGEWLVPADLAPNFERAELGGTVSIGVDGAFAALSAELLTKILHSRARPSFLIRPQGVWLVARRLRSTLFTCQAGVTWEWPVHDPVRLRREFGNGITVGPTLVYGKKKFPVAVKLTPSAVAERINRALVTIEQAWPEGQAVLALLTSRIIPLRAKGVVSFSYRHCPGLSFLNCFDRDDFDLIDDLIHENSHHHLNLLLRKHVLYRGDRNREIFYSPWRRSLRPLRGILHAAFTFTMGALLFERLAAWGARGKGQGTKGRESERLTEREVLRARLRCLEEVESVRYSIQDLNYASRHLGWLTGSGQRLVGQLAGAIGKIERKMAPHKKEVIRSTFGPALRRHEEELQRARMTYGPVRLGKV